MKCLLHARELDRHRICPRVAHISARNTTNDKGDHLLKKREKKSGCIES